MPSGRRTTDTARKRKALLDLTTVVQERPFITIDGQDYPFMAPQDVGLREMALVDQSQKLFDELTDVDLNLEDPDTEDGAVLLDKAERAVDKAVRIALPTVDMDMSARLNVMQKLQILRAFRAEGAPEAGDEETEQGNPLAPSTGASTSPDSNATTEETPAAG